MLQILITNAMCSLGLYYMYLMFCSYYPPRGPPPAVAYQQHAVPQYNQQPAYQQDLTQARMQHRERISSLKVINTNNN